MNTPTYPALDFLVRHGDAVVWTAALLPVLGGAFAWALGLSVAYAIVGVVAGSFLFLMMRSYVELVRMIVDMPK